jgi:hypothetical protein
MDTVALNASPYRAHGGVAVVGFTLDGGNGTAPRGGRPPTGPCGPGQVDGRAEKQRRRLAWAALIR